LSILTVAQGIETVVKKLANYTDTNVSIGNFTVLDEGVTRAVIVQYQPSVHGPGEPPARHNQYVSTHNFLVRVHRRYEEDGTSYKNLLSDASDVKAELDKYRKLSGTSGVVRALVTNTSDVFALFDTAGNGPYFLRLDLTLEAKETTTPNYQE